MDCCIWRTTEHQSGRFKLRWQVAHRGDDPGRVTRTSPEHSVIQAVQQHEYESSFRQNYNNERH